MADDNSALQRRALAALILAESERDGAAYGTRLPTERQLAVDLGVPRSAVGHALAVLQAEGRVSREVGRGTFLRFPAAPGSLDGSARPGGPRGPGPEPAAGQDRDRAAREAPLGGLSGSADYAPADVMADKPLFEPTAMSLVVPSATPPSFPH